MVTYLSGLKPTQVDWSIPYQYISEYNIQKWSEIQSKFAIKVNAKWKEMPQRGDADWLFQQSSKKVLRVWGFNSHIESALNQILATTSHGGTTDSSTNSSVSSAWDKYSLDGDYSRTGKGRKVETWRHSQVRSIDITRMRHVTVIKSLFTELELIQCYHIYDCRMVVMRMTMSAAKRTARPSVSALTPRTETDSPTKDSSPSKTERAACSTKPSSRTSRRICGRHIARG